MAKMDDYPLRKLIIDRKCFFFQARTACETSIVNLERFPKIVFDGGTTEIFLCFYHFFFYFFLRKYFVHLDISLLFITGFAYKCTQDAIVGRKEFRSNCAEQKSYLRLLICLFFSLNQRKCFFSNANFCFFVSISNHFEHIFSGMYYEINATICIFSS